MPKQRILTEKEIQNHISALYDRIAQNKDEIFKVALETKDNKINDLITSEEVKGQIRQISSKHGKRSSIKWTGILMGTFEVIRQILESL